MRQTGKAGEFFADRLLVLLIQVGPTTSIEQQNRPRPATPEKFVDAFVCGRGFHKAVPDLRPFAISHPQPFTGSYVGIDFWIECQFFPASVTECAPAAGSESGFGTVRIAHPSEHVPDQVITQHPVEVIGFKPPHGKLRNRSQYNLGKRPEHRLNRSVILSNVEAKRPGRRQETRHTPVSSVVLQPQRAPKHEFHQGAEFGPAFFAGSQFLTRHSGKIDDRRPVTRQCGLVECSVDEASDPDRWPRPHVGSQVAQNQKFVQTCLDGRDDGLTTRPWDPSTKWLRAVPFRRSERPERADVRSGDQAP